MRLECASWNVRAETKKQRKNDEASYNALQKRSAEEEAGKKLRWHGREGRVVRRRNETKKKQKMERCASESKKGDGRRRSECE